MKRWIVNAGISGYLAALIVGFLCVATQVRFFFPPLYFLTFDMYGGWSGYDCKMQVIGEGESGRYYKLSPDRGANFIRIAIASRGSVTTRCSSTAASWRGPA